MQVIEGLAPAKVNLSLFVTGLRADDYHLLESAVVFAGVGDRLRVERADALRLTVSGPRAAGVPTDGRNLVLKAAERLRSLRKIEAGAHISLEKHLPHGGGIGGGSSDAATAIKLLAQLWNVAPLSAEEALPLGADIPVCLAAPQPSLMRGIGETVEPLPPLPPAWLVLVNPGVEMPTPRVFKAFDALYDPTPLRHEPLRDKADFEDLLVWSLGQFNDLTKVLTDSHAPVYAPQIEAILTQLRASAGCADADMSGSGSTCWGLYESAADAQNAATKLASAHPEWWVAAAPILGPQDAAA